MTKRQMLYTVLAAMAVSAVIVIVSLTYSVKNQRAAAHRRNIESSITETQPEIGFTLKEYNGGLAVYRGNSETPYRLLDAQISLMSEHDRQQLKEGIFVLTESELNRLIEDFTS